MSTDRTRANGFATADLIVEQSVEVQTEGLVMLRVTCDGDSCESVRVGLMGYGDGEALRPSWL